RRPDDRAELLVDPFGDARRLDAVGELGDEAKLQRVDALGGEVEARRRRLEVVLGQHPERIADAHRDGPAGAAVGRSDDVLDHALPKRRPCALRLADDADDLAFAEPGLDGRSLPSGYRRLVQALA